MKKNRSVEKAVNLLSKLLKRGNDINTAIGEMLKRGIPALEISISLTRVLDMSLEEADKTLLNSEAFSHLREETIKFREMAHGVLMDEADEIIQEPDGNKILRFDLDEED